jgi:hypothetical protein
MGRFGSDIEPRKHARKILYFKNDLNSYQLLAPTKQTLQIH